MTRIGASLSGFELQLLNRLRNASAAAQINTLRLATGKKINSPADNPSGFVQLANWETQQKVVTSTQANVTAASSMVSQAQLTLDQIRTQLNTIRALAVADENQALTAAQRTANQAAIDASIATINSLAGTTINGRRLLDGSADYQVTGLENTQVLELDVVNIGDSTSQTISGQVTIAATQAVVTYTGASSATTAAATFTLTGDRGSTSISVTNGELLTSVRDKINLDSHLTGITATASGDTLTLRSLEYGTSADIAVAVTSGTFTTSASTATGTDATATINGQALTGDGNRFSLNNNRFQFSVTFVGGFSGAFSTMTVADGGLSFALTTDLNRMSKLAIRGLQANRLGGLSGNLSQLATGGSLAGLNTNAPTAVRVVDEALGMLTMVEGRVDGFADATIDSASALLSGMETNLSDAIDSINEVDEDEEETLLTKNGALMSNAIAALSILDTQRASIVKLIQSIAGLT
jgi:flagellin